MAKAAVGGTLRVEFCGAYDPKTGEEMVPEWRVLVSLNDDVHAIGSAKRSIHFASQRDAAMAMAALVREAGIERVRQVMYEALQW